jgi:hypothetical protein
LIIQIRDEPVTENDVINVVAHSQGTIITMLANMLVKQAGYSPANCVILNNSPYSLESRLMEMPSRATTRPARAAADVQKLLRRDGGTVQRRRTLR